MNRILKPWLVVALELGALGVGVLSFGAVPVSAHLGSAEVSDAAAQSQSKATLKPVAANPDIPLRNVEFDSQAEQQILELANTSREQAGEGPLKMDSGLTRAARGHAQAMLEAHQLSHQFDGEPSLPQRLAAATSVQLDQEGENVALDIDPAQAERHLMLSPPHRANLLNPAYNVVGMGVIRSGDRLYVVQDFGHALPNYSLAEVKDRIASAVVQARHHANASELARQDLPTADEAACSMALADKLGTPGVHELAQRYTVLTFTSLHPETLPQGSDRAIAGHNLRSFSIGACYARTETYPTGVYWVVLSLD
ncbi:MAG TPA: CAP domain-containing protein [Candidatus Sulfotelmatobacter sp.]